MALIRLPSLLATEAGGRNTFEVDADTLGEALRALPVSDLLLDEAGELRPLVNVYLDREPSRDLEAPLAGVAQVRVVAAIAGG